MNHTHATLPAQIVRIRSALAPGWRFTRHLGEMIVAMLAGMLVLGIAIDVLGKPPGYEYPVVEYAYMGLAMSAPMVAWMRRMGHPWRDCWEMTASMVVPMYALVAPVGLGLAAMPAMVLMGWAHVAMVGGMVLLMLCRWDTYANGAHCHHTPGPAAGGGTDPVCGMAVDPAAARSTTYQDASTRPPSPGRSPTRPRCTACSTGSGT